MQATRCEGRKTAVQSVTLFGATLLGAVALCASVAGAGTWVVHPDGSGDAPTIQAAVDSSAVWDTVLVSPGIYVDVHEDVAGEYAAVVMRSGVVLRSAEGASKTVIDVKSASAARGIACRECDSSTVVEGFTIQGSLGASREEQEDLARHFMEVLVTDTLGTPGDSEKGAVG